MGEPPLHVGFVMERHLGHRTYADNLRAIVDARTDVVADWIGVDYESADRWFERLPGASVKGTLRGRDEVRRGIDASRADVYVYNTQVPAAIGGAIARRRPYVLCTDVTPIQYDAMAAGYQHRADRGPARIVKHSWNRHVFQRAAAHAPWSDWVRDSLVSDYGIPPERIEVIPPGVDTAAWLPAKHDRGGLSLLFVGGDFERKGGARLLDALDALDDDAIELHVVTRSAIPARPRVTVHRGLSANDPELRELYRTSDAFVLPSSSETFGIAAVEAAAAGLAVVVTAVGALRELVVDGVTGFAIPPDDTPALVDALRRLRADADLRRAMGRAGRERAVRDFDAARNAGRLIDLARRCAREETIGSRTDRR